MVKSWWLSSTFSRQPSPFLFSWDCGDETLLRSRLEVPVVYLTVSHSRSVTLITAIVWCKAREENLLWPLTSGYVGDKSLTLQEMPGTVYRACTTLKYTTNHNVRITSGARKIRERLHSGNKRLSAAKNHRRSGMLLQLSAHQQVSRSRAYCHMLAVHCTLQFSYRPRHPE